MNDAPRMKYGHTASVMHHGQVMAPLNQIPIPLWYYPNPGGGGGGGTGIGEFVETYVPDEGDCPVTVATPPVATILVTNPPCNEMSLGGENIIVYDPMECIFDHDDVDLDGVKVVFVKGTIENPYYDTDETIANPDYDPLCDPEHEDYDPEAVGCPAITTPTIPNPCYSPDLYICVWIAINRCCVAADTAA